MTWLELFVRYTLMGGHIDPRRGAAGPIIQSSFQVLLDAFTKHSKQLFEHAADESICMTRASPSWRRPLMMYGFDYMPMMSGCLTLGPIAAIKLFKALLQLHGSKPVGGTPTMLASGRFKPPGLIPPNWLQ